MSFILLNTIFPITFDNYYNVVENDSDFEDEEFDKLIVFHRREHVFRPGTDHFSRKLIDRFGLSKNTVRFILNSVNYRISYRTDW